MTAPSLRLAPKPAQSAARITGLRAPAVDQERLVRGLRANNRGAERELLQRYSPIVRGVLARVLGTRSDLEDLTQEVFIRALVRLDSLSDPEALGPWLNRFAVHVARESLRAQRRRRWLSFLSPFDLHNVATTFADDDPHENAAAVRATYKVLEELSPESRLFFSLRYLQGMELTELAAACDVSLATAKRRIREANEAFFARARKHPVLDSWIGEDEP